MRKRLLAVLLAFALVSAPGLSVNAQAAGTGETADDTPYAIGGLRLEKDLIDGDSGSVSSKKNRVGASAAESAYWSQFSGTVYYDQLSTAEKKFYDGLKSEAESFLEGTADATYTSFSGGSGEYCLDGVRYSDMSSDRAYDIAVIFCFENPQYYFLNDGIGYVPDSSYWWGESDSGEVMLQVYQKYASGSVRKGYTEQFKSAVDDYLNAASQYTSDLAKETYFHDRLASETTYADNDEDQSASSLFFGHKTVCAGFSKAFSLLLNASGIKNVSVLSSSHAWNEVLIDGKWYITDVTWDQNAWPSHEFFNVSDSEMFAADIQWAHEPESCYNGIRPVCGTAHSSAVDAIDLTSSQQGGEQTGNTGNTGGNSEQNSGGTENPSTNPVKPNAQEIVVKKPPVPSTFTVKRRNSDSVRITLAGGSGVTGFVVYYRRSGAKGWNSVYVSAASGSKRFIMSGLSKNRKYQFRAVSVNAGDVMSDYTKTRTVKA